MQLTLPFLPPFNDPPSAGPSRYRKRLAKVAAKAFELGRRRGLATKRAVRAHALGAAPVVPGGTVVTVAPRPAFLAREDRGEIASLARRVSRLSISRHDPEAFHVERDPIYRELLALSRR